MAPTPMSCPFDSLRNNSREALRMRCVKPCGSTVPPSMTRFSKSANACGVQSVGESMDEVTIALFCRDEFAKSRNGRTHYRDNSYHFIIVARRGKERESRPYENEKTFFGPHSPAHLLFRFALLASCQSATGWQLSRRQHC